MYDMYVIYGIVVSIIGISYEKILSTSTETDCNIDSLQYDATKLKYAIAKVSYSCAVNNRYRSNKLQKWKL